MRGWYGPFPRLQRYDIYDDARHIKVLEKGAFPLLIMAQASFACALVLPVHQGNRAFLLRFRPDGSLRSTMTAFFFNNANRDMRRQARHLGKK